jgi:O-succinylbenzoate synthase
VKVQPLGGVRACLQLAETVRLPVVVSSALESSIGIAGGVALAAALPDLPYACGLATASMFCADVVAQPMRVMDGELAVGRVEPDDVHLRAAIPDAPVVDRWLHRLARCDAVLQTRRS